MTTKRPYNRQPTAICPDCGGKMLIRTSEQVTPTVRDLLLWCDNNACGARFVAQLSVVSRVQLAAPAASAVKLPERAWRPSNDNHVPANDNPVEPLPAADAPQAPADTMTG